MDIVTELRILFNHARDLAVWKGEFAVACMKAASEIEDLREQVQDLSRDLEEANNLEVYLRAVIDAKEYTCNDFYKIIQRHQEWLEDASHKKHCMKLDYHDEGSHFCTCGLDAMRGK